MITFVGSFFIGARLGDQRKLLPAFSLPR